MRKSRRSSDPPAAPFDRHALRRGQPKNMKSELPPMGCSREVKQRLRRSLPPLKESVLQGIARQTYTGESQNRDEPFWPPTTDLSYKSDVKPNLSRFSSSAG